MCTRCGTEPEDIEDLQMYKRGSENKAGWKRATLLNESEGSKR